MMMDRAVGDSSAYYNKGPVEGASTDGDDAPSSSPPSSIVPDEAQTGVKGIEAISQTWTQWSLVIAYLG